MTVAVFAFGSLMYEPEWPEILVRSEPARLPGYRRAFNKRSFARGCDHHEQRWRDLPVPAEFVEGPRRLSLALGTEPDPDACIEGVLLHYPREHEGELLDRLDDREGYAPDREIDGGYLRRELPVDTATGPVAAIVYLTNRESDLYTGDLPARSVVRILQHATPVAGRRARGLHYLVGVHRALSESGRSDPYLDTLVSAVDRLGIAP